MSENEKFDFKKHWLQLTPDERNAFADEAGRLVITSRRI